jgi:hypothetical protein
MYNISSYLSATSVFFFFLSSRILTSGFGGWLYVCVQLAAKKYIQHTYIIASGYTPNKCCIESLVNENGLLSLSIYIAIFIIYLFFSKSLKLFVSISHQTHLMREIWWHFHT